MTISIDDVILNTSLQMFCRIDNVVSKLCHYFIDYTSSNEIMLGEVLFTTATKKPIKVYYNDNVVEFRGVDSHIPGAVAALSSNSEPIIVVNTALLKEKQWFIDAMLMHAIGHIVLHFEGCDYDCDMRSIFQIIKSHRYEYEADEYALDNGTDMLQALKRLRTLGYNVNHRVANLEAVCLEYKGKVQIL